MRGRRCGPRCRYPPAAHDGPSSRDPSLPRRGHPRLHALHRRSRRRRLPPVLADEVCGRRRQGCLGPERHARRATRRRSLSVFDSARQALHAAVELQAAFREETQADPSLPLMVGIGLDAGEAVAVGEGYRGAALNMAARLCALAGGGEDRRQPRSRPPDGRHARPDVRRSGAARVEGLTAGGDPCPRGGERGASGRRASSGNDPRGPRR